MPEKKFIKCKQCRLAFWMIFKKEGIKFLCCRNIDSYSYVYDKNESKRSIFMKLYSHKDGCVNGKKKLLARLKFWQR